MGVFGAAAVADGEFCRPLSVDEGVSQEASVPVLVVLAGIADELDRGPLEHVVEEVAGLVGVAFAGLSPASDLWGVYSDEADSDGAAVDGGDDVRRNRCRRLRGIR